MPAETSSAENPPSQSTRVFDAGSVGTSEAPFAVPGVKNTEYTDGRLPGEWESKYPPVARRSMNREAWALGSALLLLLILSGLLIGLSSHSLRIPMTWLGSWISAGSSVPMLDVEFRLLAIFFVGILGGTTFSIKWLVHAAAKSKWHLDRRYWRLLVPLIGGVYACVVITLFDGGMMGGQAASPQRPMSTTAALAFLVGYFSDGVSGLLSNIANAVFGTLEKR